jgi:hypothetical protein
MRPSGAAPVMLPIGMVGGFTSPSYSCVLDHCEVTVCGDQVYDLSGRDVKVKEIAPEDLRGG